MNTHTTSEYWGCPVSTGVHHRRASSRPPVGTGTPMPSPDNGSPPGAPTSASCVSPRRTLLSGSASPRNSPQRSRDTTRNETPLPRSRPPSTASARTDGTRTASDAPSSRSDSLTRPVGTRPASSSCVVSFPYH